MRIASGKQLVVGILGLSGEDTPTLKLICEKYIIRMYGLKYPTLKSSESPLI